MSKYVKKKNTSNLKNAMKRSREVNQELEEIISKNNSQTRLGQDYRPYSEKPDKIVKEARKKFGK